GAGSFAPSNCCRARRVYVLTTGRGGRTATDSGHLTHLKPGSLRLPSLAHTRATDAEAARCVGPCHCVVARRAASITRQLTRSLPCTRSVRKWFRAPNGATAP